MASGPRPQMRLRGGRVLVITNELADWRFVSAFGLSAAFDWARRIQAAGTLWFWRAVWLAQSACVFWVSTKYAGTYVLIALTDCSEKSHVPAFRLNLLFV